MGKKTKYTPLRVIDEMISSIRGYEEDANRKKPTTLEQVIDVAATHGAEYAWEFLHKRYGLKPGMPASERLREGIHSVAYDFVIATFVLAHWQHNKQCYVFEKDFFDMLADMEDFEVEWSILNYLPYSNFYIELKDHPLVEGIFVEYRPNDPAIAYAVVFNEKCELCVTGINGGLVEPRETTSFKDFFEREIQLSNADLSDEYVILVRQILTFMMQACMYLCSTNAQIIEDPVQKNIYKKPTGIIKNRFQEIRKWNVGERVVKEHKRMQQEACDEKEGGYEGRRRPRQHWRRAHWHTYWVGEGRKEKALKFVAPMLINNTGDAIPVVKHQ